LPQKNHPRGEAKKKKGGRNHQNLVLKKILKKIYVKLKIVKWAVGNGCPLNPSAYLGALTVLGDSTKSWKKNLKNSDYFEIIKYLAIKECGLDRCVASAAAFETFVNQLFHL
jgi:hypothetical protein